MILLPLLTAFALTLVLIAAVLYYFPRLGLLDRPERYGLTRAPIPYFGGLTIFASFTLLAVVYLPLGQQLLGLLAGATLLTLVAFLDDAYSLPPLGRLVVQVLAAVLLIGSGVGLTHITLPFWGELSLLTPSYALPVPGEYHLVFWADLLTVVWVVTVVNATNWFDGVPGLSSGIGTLAGGVLLLLSARPEFHYFDQSAVITLAALLVGSAGAFTLLAMPPPRLLLGDTGSMLLGYLIAALAIFSGAKLATASLVLGFPLLDALLVILTRLRAGRAPWRGGEWDRERKPVHLHHRLLAAGYTEQQVAWLILVASAVFGGAALLLSTPLAKLLALLVLGAVLLGGVGYLTRHTATKAV